MPSFFDVRLLNEDECLKAIKVFEHEAVSGNESYVSGLKSLHARRAKLGGTKVSWLT